MEERMSLYFFIYISIMFFTTIFSTIVSIFSFKRRKASGALPLSLMMAAVSWWAIMQALVYLNKDYDVMIFWANMRYFAISVIPVFWFFHAREFFKMQRSKSNFQYFLWFLPSAFEIILVWTNPFHFLFYTKTQIHHTDYGNILQLDNGIFFYIYYLYNYVLIFWGIWYFVIAFIKSTRIYKKQAGVMLSAVVVPLIFNSLFVFDILPFKNIDMTPVTFAITGIMLSYGLFKVGFLDLVPIARDEVIENMDDIVIVLDNKFRILDMNPQANIIFNSIVGKKQIQNIYGKPIESIISSWPEFFQKIKKLQVVNEKISITLDDTICHYHLKVLPIQDRNGDISGKLIVMRDITTLEVALEEAKESKTQAELANSFKSRFLANMSHEIRTPMNAVIGITDLLYNEEGNEDKKEKLRTILSSAESLLTIINDVLDYSKIEAGKMKLERIPYSLSDTVRDSIEMFKVNAIRKGLNIRMNVTSKVPKKVIGDPIRIRQVLVNLIGNALKFTSFGEVRILIDVVERNGIENIFISVSDTGVGIDEAKITQLFESFNQLDTSTTRKYGGTGLGLSIVKNLIDLMGGRIEVKSRVGIGTTFDVVLPMEIFEEAIDEKPIEILFSETNKNIAISKLKILVVEDNKINQELIKTFLKNKEIKMEVADNGAQAVDLVIASKFDIILMDIQMPVMDGYEATNRIRNLNIENTIGLIIIALTANAMQGDKEKCIEAGMDNYLSKPIRAKELYKMLEAYAID
jgi:signal transduction histidine kinase/CheY-like chemotaxis protein